MAGFNPASQGMGIGSVGIGDPQTVFKTKFRWTFEVEGYDCSFRIDPHFVKVAARPSISFEEIEINFLNDRTWIPGKATWEPVTVTFLDSNKGNGVQVLSWLLAVYDFNEPTSKKMSSKRTGFSGKATLTMYDGCGTVMEIWTLLDAWPQAVNFNDLDYSSSNIADIEMTLRYSQVKYIVGCGGVDPSPCCEGCL